MNQPTRKLKRKAGSSSIEEAWATVEDRRRAQNRRHAAASRQRKVNALHEASAEGSRLKKQNELLTLTLREASAELEYLLECIEDLPTEHRDAIINMLVVAPLCSIPGLEKIVAPAPQSAVLGRANARVYPNS